jgi:hypothetical protein
VALNEHRIIYFFLQKGVRLSVRDRFFSYIRLSYQRLREKGLLVIR